MRLRITVRDLLWLAVVVALAVGWWLDRFRVEANYLQAIDNLRKFQRTQQASSDAASRIVFGQN